jgi:hypothetical protein
VLLWLVASPTSARAVDAPLVLARQQSAFAHDTLGGGPLIVTYWLINAGSEVLGEPLVTTTLAPGVTLESADPPARTRGSDLVIPLPAISPGGAVLATLTLRVPSGAATVDGGARAFADTRTRQVADSLPPTALRSTLGAAPALLASTPEAPTSDLYVLRTVGQVGCEPTALFAFVRDRIESEIYRGSLRGARGALWTGAANALDRSSLMVALLRACGVPARYASGTLSAARAQELILAMFEGRAPRAVGGLDVTALPTMVTSDLTSQILEAARFLPGAGVLADPANDPALLADAARHHWVEYLDGGGFVALDASFAGADVGDVFTTPAASFAAAPAAERHTVQVALDVELMPLGLNGTFLRVGDALAQALGTPTAGFEHVGGLLVQTATVLDETLSAVELVGEPVSIGQFVNSRGTGGAGLSISVNTYSPWLQIGEQDDVRRGTDFEETISTFASTLLTGMFLRTTVTSPDGTTTQQMREVVDRLGFAARRGEGAALALTLDGAPTLTEADVVTIDVNSGGYDLGEGAARHDRMATRQATLQTALATVPSAGPTAAQIPGLAAAGRDYMIAVTRLLAGAQVAGSSLRSTVLGEALGVRGYAATPRLTIAQARSRRIDGTEAAGLSLDLRKRDGRAVVAPGQWAAAAQVFETARGVADSHVEGLILEGFGTPVPDSFERFAEAADAAGLSLRTITAQNLSDVDGLALPPEARARIRAAVVAGRVAIVPEAPALVGSRLVTMWLENEPATGETISVGEDGGHVSLIEYAALGNLAFQGILLGFLDGLGYENTADAYKVGLAWGARNGLGGGALYGIATGSFFVKLATKQDVKNPWEAAGYIVGKTWLIWIHVSNSVVKALQHTDPPASGLLVDPDVAEPGVSGAEATVSAGAAFSGTSASGTVAARYHRAADVAFHPEAVAGGLGASGGDPALNFLATATVPLAGDAVNLDLASGELTLGSLVVDGPVNVGLAGATGSLTATDAGTTDDVTLDATFERALVLSAAPAAGTLAQGRPLVVATELASNAADSYVLTAEVPETLHVSIDATGHVTIVPVAGVTSGDYLVRLHAASTTRPDLRAEATVLATVEAPGAARVDVEVALDPIWSVPVGDTIAPSVHRVTIFNASLTDDVFDVAVSGLAADDFTLAVESVRVPAGATGVVGLVVHPSGALLAPGTPRPFEVTATGRGGGLTDTDAVAFVYPTVLGVRPRLDPLGVHVLPGDSVPAELVLVAASNAPATMALEASVPPGLGVSGLPADVTLAPGETRTIPLTLTVASDAPVGTSLPIAVTVDLCNGAARPPCTVPDPSVRVAFMGVLVGVPETLCLLDGAIETALADLAGAAVTLQRLGLALSRLALAPGDAALQSESIAAANATMLFLHEQGLTERANQLHDVMLPVDAGDVPGITAALDALCTTLAALPGELAAVAERAAHGFTARLVPSNRIVGPGEAAVYGLEIVHTGTKPTTIDLTVTGIPAGVSATLGHTSVTLAPGERLGGTGPGAVTVTLTSAVARPAAVGFAVHGTVAGGVDGDAPGVFAVREGMVDVSAVTPTPRLAETAGTPVRIAASVSNRANVPREVTFDVRVEDEVGTMVLRQPPMPASLGTGADTTVDLGALDTAALADGAYTAVVTVQTPSGGPVPGQEGRGAFLVGIPLQATAVVEPAVVAPGEAVQVRSRVRVSGRPPRDPGSGVFDQYGQAVADAATVTTPEAALGVPDRQTAVIAAGGSLTIDLGPDLARMTDGAGADLVIFEGDPHQCMTPHPAAYTVAVAEDLAGPFTTLGTASGARHAGDEFDLLTGPVTGARYIRITATGGPIEVDAVLNAHPARPGGVQIEYHHPVGFQSGIANTPVIGDLDGDGHPEIAFNVQTSPVMCETIVLDGVTKTEKFRLPLPGRTGVGAAFCGEASGVAMGNLDDDPEGELLVHAPTDNTKDFFVALNADGSELFRRQTPNEANQTSMELANVDADPRPEILWPGGFRQDDASDGLAVVLYGHPIAVDLDDDGTPELVGPSGGAPFSNLQAIRTDGTSLWSTRLATGLGAKLTGRPSVADLDGDGRPDFAVWAANQLGGTQALYAVRHDGSLLWTLPIPVGPKHCADDPEQECVAHADCPGSVCKIPETAASTPAIADVNGDGKPEVVIWLRDVGEGDRGSIVAFEGATGRELWRVEARDPGGIEPNVSAADLDGDGDAEVLWNGACDGFTIVDGAAGRVVYRDLRVASSSGRDHPAIADADADGRLEVVTGDDRGLYVFGAGIAWTSGRRVWNQTNYSITNVEDDLTIPTAPPAPWRFHNTAHFQGPQLTDLAHATVDVAHRLADAVTFVPGDIVPPATGVAGQAIDWHAEFPTTMGAAFDVPATLPPLAPGETRAVSVGDRVDADIVLLDGTHVQVTIPLAPATVSAPHVIGIAPASQTVDAGTPATFLVTLTNARSVAETFTVSALGIDPAFVTLPAPTPVPPGASLVLPVVVTLPTEAPAGILDFALGVVGDGGTADDAGAQLVVNAVAAPVVPGGIQVAIVPAAVTLGRGGSSILDVIVTSGLDRVATLALSAGPGGDLEAVVSDPELVVPPGGSARTRITVTAPAGAAPGLRQLELSAVEVGVPDVTDTTSLAVTVSDRGVGVALSPDAATTASDGRVTLQAVVTNTGAVEDTFDVAAGGPLAPFATLGTTSVTLGAGAQATLPVTLAGLDAFLQQRSFLLLTATAATNPAITAADASSVDVAARRAVAVRFAPASVVRLGPGSVALDLVVENTGNACDERYLLEVTTSPGIAATIASTPFVVPAGQAAALRLEATAAALGRYDVSIVATTDTTNPACPPMPPAAASDAAEVSFVDTLPTTTSTTTSTTTLPTTPDPIPTTTSSAVPVTTTSTTVPGLDHFLLYKVRPGAGTPRFAQLAPLTLADRFGSARYQVVKPKHLGLPADKNGEGVADATTHLVDYQVKAVKGTPAFPKHSDLQIGNQCNTLRIEVSKPSALLVPALKSLVAPLASPDPADHELDHYLCYRARTQKKLADGSALPKFPKGIQVDVADHFQARRYDLRRITRLCTPVATSGAPVVVSGPDAGQPVPIAPADIRHPELQLVCYRAKLARKLVAQTGCGFAVPGDAGTSITPRQAKHAPRDPIYVNGSFGAGVLASAKEAELCIPSTVDVRP